MPLNSELGQKSIPYCKLVSNVWSHLGIAGAVYLSYDNITEGEFTAQCLLFYSSGDKTRILISISF